MAAPPPSSEPETAAITFGIAAMDEVLEDADVEFPAETDQLLAAIGDRSVPYDPAGNTVQLRTVIEETDRRRFESRRELLNALHPAFEERRRGGGLGDWFRSLFPS